MSLGTTYRLTTMGVFFQGQEGQKQICRVASNRQMTPRRRLLESGSGSTIFLLKNTARFQQRPCGHLFCTDRYSDGHRLMCSYRYDIGPCMYRYQVAPALFGGNWMVTKRNAVTKNVKSTLSYFRITSLSLIFFY